MTEVKKGSFETTRGNLQKIIQWTMGHLDMDNYNKAYFNLADGVLRTIANAGQANASFCTFREPFVQNTELHEDEDENAGMEAIVKMTELQDYLNFFEGERVTLEFLGPEADPDAEGYETVAEKMVVNGDWEAEVYLPSSKKDYESKALKTVKHYDERDRWIHPGGGNPDTTFVTTAEEMQRVNEIWEYDNLAINHFPLVVEDEEVRLSATDNNERNSIEGSLEAEDVSGPDVHNEYSRGVDELFGNISGNIEVQVDDGAPLVVVQSDDEGSYVLRYSMMPAE